MTTIRELVAEAEENFGTGRHKNSAMLFKRAGLETLEKGIVDGIYLIYRSLYDMEQEEMTKEQVQLMLTTAKVLLQQVAKTSTRIIEQGTDDAISYLRLEEQALRLLGNTEERDPVVASLVQALRHEYDETGTIDLLYDASGFAPSDEGIISQILRTTLVDITSDLKNTAFDGDLVAASKLVRVLALMEQLKEGTAIPISEIEVDGEYELHDLQATAVKIIALIGDGKFNERTTSDEVKQIIDRSECSWLELS